MNYNNLTFDYNSEENKFKSVVMTHISILFILVFMIAHPNMAAQARIEPMITASYSQSEPYNKSCPENYAAGCGPVAIAQILKFYGQPTHGYGEVCYKSSNISDSIRVNFEQFTFDWVNMTDTYSPDSQNATTKGNVADLIFACGAAMYAQYGTSTSINNYAKMLYGLQHFLHFSPNSRYIHRKYYSTSEWLEILNDQLRAGHPVFYRGSWLYKGKNIGHMFIIDGMDEEGLYHVNFGHGGRNDKFLDINVINQTGSYPGGKNVCYNASQAMTINCFPTPDATYPAQSCMLDDYIILNNDISVQSVSLLPGEPFTLSCKLRNCCGDNSKINFGWGIVKDNALQTILTKNSYNLKAGNTFKKNKNIIVKLPTDIADGEYTLKLFSSSTQEPEWQEVYDDAINKVSVLVSGGKATITIPNNHTGDPDLYLYRQAYVVSSEKDSNDITIGLPIANETVNNFQDNVRIEITTSERVHSYDVILPVYSQTSTEYQVHIPDFSLSPGESIVSIKSFYYYALEDNYRVMGMSSDIENIYMNETVASDLYIFSIDGVLIKRISAEKVGKTYSEFLQNLPKGLYIIKEGKTSRKIAI